MPDLVLGPVLRYVDGSTATVWIQADGPCDVEVLGHRARTFEVEGHHFAIVVVRGLPPASRTPYGVALDGRPVWPPPDSELPASVVQTAAAPDRVRLVFGSCRDVAPHEPPFTLAESADPRGHGIDALRAYALELAAEGDRTWPDALLLLGDQLYADEPPRGLLRRRGRRPDGELRAVSFAGYAALYRASWGEPAVRWLLSTVPSMMIFDDHEIVDEWRISQAWVDERRGRADHDRRVTAGLMAYWVFQHLGNLSPADLAHDRLLDHARRTGDASAALQALAEDADREAVRSRWSFCRELGRARLLVLDSRAARRLQPGDRRILADAEWSWAAERARAAGEHDHLLLASSLPFLLPAGLHHLEAVIERAGDGAWGGLAARAAERLRRSLNLGHWASFQASFRKLAGLLDELASHGRASIVMLSGDVHHGYAACLPGRGAPIWQVVCSPFRKHVGRYERFAMRLGDSRPAAWAGAAVARAAGIGGPRPAWRLRERPAYVNQIGTLELDGRQARVRLRTAEGSDWRAPRLRTLWERRLA